MLVIILIILHVQVAVAGSGLGEGDIVQILVIAVQIQEGILKGGAVQIDHVLAGDLGGQQQELVGVQHDGAFDVVGVIVHFVVVIVVIVVGDVRQIGGLAGAVGQIDHIGQLRGSIILVLIDFLFILVVGPQDAALEIQFLKLDGFHLAAHHGVDAAGDGGQGAAGIGKGSADVSGIHGQLDGTGILHAAAGSLIVDGISQITIFIQLFFLRVGQIDGIGAGGVTDSAVITAGKVIGNAAAGNTLAQSSLNGILNLFIQTGNGIVITLDDGRHGDLAQRPGSLGLNVELDFTAERIICCGSFTQFQFEGEGCSGRAGVVIAAGDSQFLTDGQSLFAVVLQLDLNGLGKLGGDHVTHGSQGNLDIGNSSVALDLSLDNLDGDGRRSHTFSQLGNGCLIGSGGANGSAQSLTNQSPGGRNLLVAGSAIGGNQLNAVQAACAESGTIGNLNGSVVAVLQRDCGNLIFHDSNRPILGLLRRLGNLGSSRGCIGQSDGCGAGCNTGNSTVVDRGNSIVTAFPAHNSRTGRSCQLNALSGNQRLGIACEHAHGHYHGQSQQQSQSLLSK